MGIFKYINFPVFIISLAFGFFAVYIMMPDMRKIYVYPSPENYAILQYKDKSDRCFSLKQEEVSCPNDESQISRVPPQV